ncbi:carbonic anhydrase [Streptomyces sp. NA02950]|uniref:carbonic anhydrase n=1 Tax=Streptomyces sp. NA02950 TaxID=2742137 RepID=UPI00159265F8|nr:carbonic anhydrase [Streptomyces sp. NA02950]QKV96332.1 carbonic anhydrase [Streptomyces sp. NA02950]
MQALLDRARSLRQRVDFAGTEYRKLAEGQNPEALFITCSDSRVIPAFIMEARPGEIFELRNAGNIVPPPGGHGASGEAATIEYALRVLNVQDVVVCGHSHCGAMGALQAGTDLSDLPGVDSWLELARPGLAPLLVRDAAKGGGDGPSLPEVVQRNVVNQLSVLAQYPAVRERVAAGRLRLHGWYYEVDTGRLYELGIDGLFQEHAS